MIRKKNLFYILLISLLIISVYYMHKLLNIDFKKPYIEIGVGNFIMYPFKEGVLALGIIISTIIYSIIKLGINNTDNESD